MDIVLRLLIARLTRGGRIRITAGGTVKTRAKAILAIRTSTLVTMAEVAEAGAAATALVLLSLQNTTKVLVSLSMGWAALILN